MHNHKDLFRHKNTFRQLREHAMIAFSINSFIPSVVVSAGTLLISVFPTDMSFGGIKVFNKGLFEKR